MHLRALELVGSVKTEASMESEKASFGGPDWQEPAGVPKCFNETKLSVKNPYDLFDLSCSPTARTLHSHTHHLRFASAWIVELER